LVTQLAWCHAQVHHVPAQIEGVTYGSDLRFFTNNAGMPGVLYGPGDVNLAHTNRERIEVSEIIKAAKALARIIIVWEAGNDRRLDSNAC
jgi:acetylornithine deacetylase